MIKTQPISNLLKAQAPKSSTDFTRKKTKDENGLNGLERDWLSVLQVREYSQQLSDIGIHAITLKLADDCRYTPDFVALVNGRLVIYEVKGFMRDDALVKLKTAARCFPYFDFVMVTRKAKVWTEKPIEA